MIRVHYSNRLENLIAPLATAVAEQQRTRPLDRIPIIVPSQIVEQFVKLRLSEAIGVAANLEFPFLRRYLARLIESANPRTRIVDLDEIQIALFESLRAGLPSGSREMMPVRKYIGAGAESDVELRAFDLAGEVAWLFREYSITRRAMLFRWTRHANADAEPLSEAESWQRSLWRSIFADGGRMRLELASNPEHELLLLPDAFESVAAERLKSALPRVLHVFGIAYAGPAYARIFAQIGELIDVNIYALNPCLEFWEDVDTPAGIARDSWIHRHQKLGAKLEESTDPFSLDITGDTPALRLWARPGREHIRLLNELTDCDFDAYFTHPAQSDSPTLLARLQESILVREPERPSKDDGQGFADDGSINFVACPGIRREAEIVASAIWSLIDGDQRSRDRLRFHEIGVLVPDGSYDSYLPHIDTVFAEQHQIPIDVVNQRFVTDSRISEAVSLLLRLPLGRFSRHEMMRLLTHPSIGGAEANSSSERWREWCEGLGVFFGADGEDFAGTYLPRDIFHWDQALKRLALGVFMSADRGGKTRFFAAPGGLDYLPYETAQDEVPAVATLVRTSRALLADAIEIKAGRLTLAQWAQLLTDLILTYIHTSDPSDDQTRDYCVAAIESIATSEIRSEPVSYGVACELALARISDRASQGGQFAEKGVAVGPLSALRAIPFRVIFLLGLNENDFPERPRHDPLDLRLSRRRAGDVTPTERDRYMFLETLAAARERLCLSYVARDAQTGDRLEPSSVVRELQFILGGYVDQKTLQGLTVEHPVSRYDLRYFKDLPQTEANLNTLVSFDPQARRGARIAGLRQDLARHCGDTPLPGRDEPLFERLPKKTQEKLRPALRIVDAPESKSRLAGAPAEISLPLSALRRFLECPLQGAARYALGIIEDDEADADDYADEPVAQSVLDRTTMLRDAFWTARGDSERVVDEYLAAFRLAQVKGHAPAGPFADAARSTDRAQLKLWIAQAENARVVDLARWQDIRIGRADEFAHADRIIDEISISVLAQRGSADPVMQMVKIYGTAGFVSPDLEASMLCVLRKDTQAKDFLRPFLSAIALAAAGEKVPKRFRAIVIGTGDEGDHEVRILTVPTAEEARNYLSVLVTDLLFGQNYSFLPIEAVEAVLKANSHQKNADVIDLIDGYRDEYQHSSSDYGPIRDAKRFDPPSREEVTSIVERRFGLIQEIFKKGER